MRDSTPSITFGAKITFTQLGTQSAMLDQWKYDGIFLGYQNTMHNIKYWEFNTGTVKTVKHDSKDKFQYGDVIENRPPFSKDLMEVFTESLDHASNMEQEKTDIQ